MVQPDNFFSFSSPGAYYVVYECNGWVGDVDITFDVVQDGKVVGVEGLATGIAGPQSRSVSLYGTGGLSYRPTVSNGPATLAVTTNAYSRLSNQQQFTLRSVARMQIVE